MKTKCSPATGQASYVRFVKLKEASLLTGKSRAEIYRCIAAGTFPRPIRLGERSIAFHSREIEAWQEARIAERDAKGAA